MFEFLFKYPAELYRQGTIALDAPWYEYLLGTLIVAAAASALAGYLRKSAALTTPDRAVLAALRSTWVALLLLALLSPALIVSVAEPGRGDIVFLLDDSRSMRIDAAGDGSRAHAMLQDFAPADGTVVTSLQQRFDTHHVRFALQPSALEDGSTLAFDSARSNLGSALNYARTQMSDISIGALVLVSDGGHDDGERLEQELLAWQALGVPVHTVGVGTTDYPRDLELADVSLPADVLRGDWIEPEITIRQQGYAGQQATLRVESDSLLKHQQLITLPQAGQLTLTLPPLQFEAPGPHRLVFELLTQGDERVVQNNRRSALVDVAAEPLPLLHFEGEPRFEVKFLRRALHDDDGLRLVSLVRTAENKYYRVGIRDQSQLAGGFPEQAAPLFEFTTLVLGSVQAALLSAEQQQMVVDFVARRGGALLLLGARHGFAEGGYGSSALAELMPVRLNAQQTGFRTAVAVTPTRAGTSHPVVRALLDAAPEQTLSELPPLTVVNPLRAVKAGATVLLDGDDGDADSFVVLAYQRYGRGTVAVLNARDTWRWQMHHSVAVDDRSHETMWRQLLRWLARPVPQRLQLRLEPPHPVAGERVRISAEPLDAAYRPITDARVVLTTTTPLGDRFDQSLHAQPDAPGTATTELRVDHSGLYELELELSADDASVTRTLALAVDANGEEYHRAELDEALLQRIAATTGGRYVRLADARQLADSIETLPSDVSSEQRLPLRDAPVLFLAIVLAACLEWLLRRRRELA